MGFRVNNLRKCISALAIFVIAISCKAPLTGISGNYVYKTECMGTQSDGTILVKAWGTGANEKEAVERAKINALKDFLFKGLRDGKADCGTVSLLTDVNVYEKNKAYFTDFFSKKGDYSDFAKSATIKKDFEVKPARSGVTVGVLVRILQENLKQKINKDYNQLKR